MLMFFFRLTFGFFVLRSGWRQISHSTCEHPHARRKNREMPNLSLNSIDINYICINCHKRAHRPICYKFQIAKRRNTNSHIYKTKTKSCLFHQRKHWRRKHMCISSVCVCACAKGRRAHDTHTHTYIYKETN